jgi:hypothetical protein
VARLLRKQDHLLHDLYHQPYEIDYRWLLNLQKYQINKILFGKFFSLGCRSIDRRSVHDGD